MGGSERYSVRLSLAGKYRIGLNIVRTGEIGVKGLFLEYGEYSAEIFANKYSVRLGLSRKYRIGLNIVRTGKIGVKGLFLEYGEYSAEYSPTPSLKPLSR